MRLSHPDKLVYSPHDYGPGVWQQSWFKASDFPANLPKVWDDHWAYLQREHLAAVLLGEFGGRSVGQDTEGTWQRSLVTYLKQTGISYTYWSWNPNSGDTGGVLKDDWSTIDQAKLGILAAYQWPKLGAVQEASAPPGGSPNGVLPAYQWPAPAATPSPPTTSAPGSTPTPHRRSPPWTMK